MLNNAHFHLHNKVFDPLGLLSPCTIIGKIILQAVWTEKGLIGANRELRNIVQQLKLENDKINGSIAVKGISWVTTPPKLPHSGGLWESGMKSFEFHLKGIVDNALLTFEQLIIHATEKIAPLKGKHQTWSSGSKNENTLPLTWSMDQVVEVFPGAVSVVRVVQIKTVNGSYKRAVSQVFSLPLKSDCRD
ncbi:hypothetical protein ILUMI_09421 [Ignelater luminosus]|uniref:DUF5641 domain-containing protein n=1 Tax=Ignelater luminosus TaxID=2038154 RepID=A0A8K0D008_IGNLU|nr:hypothetical protein ILUMI_09421 [Ignelater luminosus]